MEHELAESRAEHSHDAWEPEWMRGLFSASMCCDACGDPVFVIGDWDVREYHSGWNDSAELLTRYRTHTFVPPPPLIQIPEAVRENVSDEVWRALSLFWSDSNACGNAIRSAIEAILDDRKVQKAVSKERRGIKLSLHRRIEKFAEKDEQAAHWLMAVKWIGNAGSHRGALSRSDLFDGFDLLEHVLEHLYSDRAKALARLARSINRRRRPLSS